MIRKAFGVLQQEQAAGRVELGGKAGPPRQETKARVAPARVVEDSLEAPKAAPIEPAEPAAHTSLDDSLNLSVAAIDYLPLDDGPDEIEQCHREDAVWQPPAGLAGLEDAMLSLRQPYRLSEAFPSHMAVSNLAFEWASLPVLDEVAPSVPASVLDAFELDGSLEICEADEGK